MSVVFKTVIDGKEHRTPLHPGSDRDCFRGLILDGFTIEVTDVVPQDCETIRDALPRLCPELVECIERTVKDNP